MSFDVFLQAVGESAFDESRQSRVRTVLERERHEGPDDFGFYLVEFSDGSHVEFSAAGLEGPEPFTSCAFHIRGFSRELARFMLDIARAGDMVMFPTMADAIVILVDESQRSDLPPDILGDDGWRAVVCRTALELEATLMGGFDAWVAYRVQVLSAPPTGADQSRDES